MKFFINCLLVSFAILVFSCAGKSKKMDLLPFDTLKVVVWDMLNAEEFNNVLITKDSTLKNSRNNLKLYQQVFFIHHVSKEQFYYSYEFYEQHPDRFKLLMDSVSAYAPRQRFKSKY